MADKKNKDQKERPDFSVNHDQLVNQNDKEATQSLLSDSDKIENTVRRAGYQVSQFDTSSTSGSTDFFDAMAYGSASTGSLADDKKEEKKEDEKPAPKKAASKPGPKPGAKSTADKDAADKAASEKAAVEKKAAEDKAEAEKAAAQKQQNNKNSANS